MNIKEILKHKDIQALKWCEEKNDWHEEDVFTHTMRVYEGMCKVGFQPWVLKATLLHDVGKGYLQRSLKPQESYTGHEKISAQIANSILSLDEPHRYKILGFIENHGLVHKEIFLPRHTLDTLEFAQELYYFGLVETINSRLLYTRPNEYIERVKAYKDVLGERIV